MGFAQAIQSGWSHYATFSGRASRSEYWYWVLFGILVGIAAAIANQVLETKAVSALATLVLLLPGIAVAIRRLHDTDRSGWWYLLVFTVIGAIPLVIWFCFAGTTHANRFGENPLGRATAPLPLDGSQRMDARIQH